MLCTYTHMELKFKNSCEITWQVQDTDQEQVTAMNCRPHPSQSCVLMSAICWPEGGLFWPLPGNYPRHSVGGWVTPQGNPSGPWSQGIKPGQGLWLIRSPAHCETRSQPCQHGGSQQGTQNCHWCEWLAELMGARRFGQEALLATTATSSASHFCSSTRAALTSGPR